MSSVSNGGYVTSWHKKEQLDIRVNTWEIRKAWNNTQLINQIDEWNEGFAVVICEKCKSVERRIVITLHATLIQKPVDTHVPWSGLHICVDPPHTQKHITSER